MCRFNYRTMKPEDEEFVAPIETLDIIDENWTMLYNMIPEMLPVIQREVFDKGLNLLNTSGRRWSVDFDWVSDAIMENRNYVANIIDLRDDYAICTRLYITQMLSAFHEVEGENYSEFVQSVNDFIQHEYDNM